ncbi:hypothetical protein QAD02_022758 [Eretmocerus hayati]|uniref:Uncharacterized protein n=1 Tax=Eretmocerus hayati TaxID=131215 RepID=A0ACC2PTP0_9HYME|nr:hypothetical protein QAD02_022758 [Eretmocerus hayati]
MDHDQNGKRVCKNLDVVTKAQLLDDISKDEWEFIQQICALPELDITMSDQREERCETQNLEVNTAEFGGESATNSSSAIIANIETPNIFNPAVNNRESRVQNIVLDLMEGEKSRPAQGPDEILMDIGLVPSNMNIVSTTTSGLVPSNMNIVSTTTSGDYTYAATGDTDTTNFSKYSESSAVTANGIPMDDHGYSVNLPVYAEINSTESMSLQEVNYDSINTPVQEYVEVIDNHDDNKEGNDAHGTISLTEEGKNNEAQMEFLQWYAPDLCENTVVTEPVENIQSSTEQNSQLGTNKVTVTVEVHSIEVENEHVLSQKSDAPNINSRSDQTITDASTSGCNLTKNPRDTTSDTINIDAAERIQTRSSVKNQQSWNNINTQEEIAKIRYPDLDDVRYQADNNCPDLENPFWENIKNFSCKRSVFYRKDKLGTICPLSYFKEKHEAMGFKADSRHILIKSNKNPKMPICMLCHCCRYEVKDAIKCEFCVKAYFELMTSEMGDQREIIDKWE